VRQPAASIVDRRHASEKPRALAPVEESDAGGPGSLEPVSAITPGQALAELEAAAADGRLDAFCARHGIELMVAFGSAADPARVDHARDLDVAIRFAADAERDLLDALNGLLAWLRLDELDVMDIDRADVIARQRALVAQAHPLYEARRGLWAEAQMAAHVRYLDTAWLRRLRWQHLTAPR